MRSRHDVSSSTSPALPRWSLYSSFLLLFLALSGVLIFRSSLFTTDGAPLSRSGEVPVLSTLPPDSLPRDAATDPPSSAPTNASRALADAGTGGESPPAAPEDARTSVAAVPAETSREDAEKRGESPPAAPEEARDSAAGEEKNGGTEAARAGGGPNASRAGSDPAISAALPARLSLATLCVRMYGLRGAILRATFDPSWDPLLDRLEKDGFPRNAMEPLFARLGPKSYSPAYMAAKITELHGVGGIGISREEVPTPEPPEDFARPVADITVGSCLNFLRENDHVFAEAEKKYGVPRTVILAILLIETGLGTDLGNDTALRALASMAATVSPELLGGFGNARQKSRLSAQTLMSTLRQKSNWAYNELAALIRYAQDNGYNAVTLPCSIYGAIGLCQFMPSNIGLFAVDGDADGRVDLFSLPDAIFSVAHYLEANGWRTAASDAGKQSVIYTYNHDDSYAASVLATARHLDRALKGAVSPQRIALVGNPGRRNPYARLDPSLRRGRAVPSSARVKSLGDYQGLLQ